MVISLFYGENEMTTHSVDILCIMLTYNTKEMSLQSIAALQKSLQVSGLSYQFTVYDNASSDGSGEAITSEFPDVCVVRSERNLGFAKACNDAVSRGPCASFILFANSDIDLEEQVIGSLVRLMDKHPPVALLSPIIQGERQNLRYQFSLSPDLMTETFGSLYEKLKKNTVFEPQKHLEVLNVPAITGAFMLVRSEVFKRLGGFDERFFFFLEETDLCLRIRRMGQQVGVSSQIKVTHFKGKSANKNPVNSRHNYLRSKIQFLKKWYSSFTLLYIYMVYFLKFSVNAVAYFVLACVTGFLNLKFRQQLYKCLFLQKEMFCGMRPPLISSASLFPMIETHHQTENWFVPENLKGELIKKSSSAETWLIENEGSKWVLKKDVAKPFLSRLFRGSVGQKQYHNSLRLYGVNINVPKPRTYGLNCDQKGIMWDNFVSAAILSNQVLTLFFRYLTYAAGELPIIKTSLIQQLAYFVADLHKKAIYHKDLKGSNILFEQEGPDFKFYLIDLEKISYGFFFSRRIQIKNLVQLNKSFMDFEQVTLKERLCFLLIYAEIMGFDRKTRRVWRKRIADWTVKIWHNKQIHKD